MKNELTEINVNLDITEDLLGRIKTDWEETSKLPVVIWLEVATHKFIPIGWVGEFANNEQLSILEEDFTNGYHFESNGIQFYGSVADKDFQSLANNLKNKCISDYKEGRLIIRL